MRILFDMCVYDMRNKGNVALLQVALRRLQEYWPQASLEVVSISPHILKLYCPTAHPIGRDGYTWIATDSLKDKVFASLPIPLLRFMFEIREAVWYYSPTLQSSFRGRKKQGRVTVEANVESDLKRNADNPSEDSTAHRKLLSGINLYIATGAQYMSDACKPDALQMLDRMQLAHQMGIPIFMVGQGIGPIHDRELQSCAAQVLPLADFIFIRETLAAPAILQASGVSPERIIFTGDDAIELAYEARPKSYGNSIGVSVRIGDYTEVASKQIESMQSVLERARQKYKTSLVPIPISQSAHELDDKILSQLHVREGWITLNRFAAPIDLIKKVSRCRLVVTGTFHAAVFALAQGIPVIGLVKSEMYVDKFKGLADQFGDGCQIVELEDKNFQDKIDKRIEKLWTSADDLRPQLLLAAERQIQLGKSAYQRIFDLVCARSKQEL